MADQNINNQTVTWNSGGTTFDAIKMNVTDTASAVASRLLLLQVGGIDKFKVGKDGTVTAAGNLALAGSATIAGNLTVIGTLTAAGIAGAVTGPASSVDNAIARFNGTSGGVLQNSAITVSDSGAMAGGTTASFSSDYTTDSGGYVSSITTVILAATGSGTAIIRPNGRDVSTGQMSIASSGAVTINGTLTVTG